MINSGIQHTIFLALIAFHTIISIHSLQPCHSICFAQEGMSTLCTIPQSIISCITCDSKLRNNAGLCTGQSMAFGNSITTDILYVIDYATINGTTIPPYLADLVQITQGSNFFSGVPQYTGLYSNLNSNNQIQFAQATSSLDFTFLNIPFNCYQLTFKIAGQMSPTCTVGATNVIMFGYSDLFSRGVSFVNTTISGTPFNKALPGIDMFSTASFLGIKIAFQNLGSNDSSCGYISISDITLIVDLCDVSCLSCSSITPCTCDATATPPNYLSIVAKCVTACPSGTYLDPVIPSCIICPGSCSFCSLIAGVPTCSSPPTPTIPSSIACQSGRQAAYYLDHKQCIITVVQYEAMGIIFVIIDLILVIFILVVPNPKVYHQIMAFTMTIQCMGLIRTKDNYIDGSIISLLRGFSYFQLQFLPNGFYKLFPNDYTQYSFTSVALSLGHHNSVSSLGSILQLIIVLQICLAVYFALTHTDQIHLNRIKLFQQSLLVIFMTLLLYYSLLSIVSLSLSNNLSLGSEYKGSIVFSLLILISICIYVILLVCAVRRQQLYKINSIIRGIILVILARQVTAGIILWNMEQLIFSVIDIYFYHSNKICLTTYIIQRILILIAFNVAILSPSFVSLFVVVGLSMLAILCIKLYYIYCQFTQKELNQQMPIHRRVHPKQLTSAFQNQSKQSKIHIFQTQKSAKTNFNISENTLNRTIDITRLQQQISEQELATAKPNNINYIQTSTDHRGCDMKNDDLKVVYLAPGTYHYQENVEMAQESTKVIHSSRMKYGGKGGKTVSEIKVEDVEEEVRQQLQESSSKQRQIQTGRINQYMKQQQKKKEYQG